MLITDQKALTDYIASIKGASFITIDTEFLREKTYYPKLCLIQICDPDGKAAAIDPLADGIDLAPVLDILRDESVLKIFHAARQDLEIFYQLMNEVPKPFFDTQIAAMVCGYGDSVGYENLVRNLTEHSIDKSAQYTDWSRRPLSERQITYALGDVIYLVEIYQKLAADLESRGRTSWVYEEEGTLADPATYQNKPEEAWRRVKVKSPKPQVLGILREVAAWREEQAQKRDIPRSWVLRDETLADMAAQAPRDEKALARVRNMPKDFPNSSNGKKVLGLIAKAKSADPKTWPAVKKRKTLPPHASATVDILKMLLKVEASQNEVAAKLIASSDELEQIAQDDNADIKVLEGWRYEVFGGDAVALKEGRLAIGMKNGEITKYRIDGKSDLYKDVS